MTTVETDNRERDRENWQQERKRGEEMQFKWRREGGREEAPEDTENGWNVREVEMEWNE